MRGVPLTCKVSVDCVDAVLSEIALRRRAGHGGVLRREADVLRDVLGVYAESGVPESDADAWLLRGERLKPRSYTALGAKKTLGVRVSEETRGLIVADCARRGVSIDVLLRALLAWWLLGGSEASRAFVTGVVPISLPAAVRAPRSRVATRSRGHTQPPEYRVLSTMVSPNTYADIQAAAQAANVSAVALVRDWLAASSLAFSQETAQRSSKRLCSGDKARVPFGIRVNVAMSDRVRAAADAARVTDSKLLRAVSQTALMPASTGGAARRVVTPSRHPRRAPWPRRRPGGTVRCVREALEVW